MKASEMEHAARSHIKKKLDEDRYQGLPDRLEEIVAVHELVHLDEPHHTPELGRGWSGDARLRSAQAMLTEHAGELVGV